MSLAEVLWLVAPPLCWSCGEDARRGGPLCAGCRRRLEWLDHEPVELGGVRAWAPVAYEGPARDLVGGLKFRGAAGVADALAAPMVAGAPPGWLAPAPLGDPGGWRPPVLVPVPAQPRRMRRRGYNQAERIAAAVGRRAGLRVRDCLVRARGVPPQTGRPRAERIAAAPGTVALRSGARVPPRALLVDDVITTGATAAACAEALRVAGCTRIEALSYARTPGR